MKILVCISKAPDTTTKISFTDNDTKFDEDKVQFIVNPYDEWYALVRGLELKEAAGGTVTIVTAGGADHDPIIRKALAIGADNAVRIDTDPKDGYSAAKEIAAYAQGKDYDLILLGKETINYNGSQVGGMIAELLGLPYVSVASKLDVNDGTATVEQDMPGGKQVMEGQLPLVISCAKGMAEQRIPNMRGIMAARTKPLEVVEPTGAEPLVTAKKFSLPSEKGAVKLIDADNMEELVELLHSEAKVI
ncbi:MAG: electron transfer flavoprotein subunit beta/FixA family protein [Flavobacteriales bacterium]|nr:electron transfer flavoprotein subunit beta/FixA family protein [Flavobacteriales bacterium]